MNYDSIIDLRTRFDRLERSHRRLKRWGTLGILGVVVLAFAGHGSTTRNHEMTTASRRSRPSGSSSATRRGTSGPYWT